MRVGRLSIPFLCVIALSLVPRMASAIVIPGPLLRCTGILSPVASAFDALPFARRFLDRKLSAGWLERFDVSFYQKMKLHFRGLDPLPPQAWDEAEASVAYIEVLIERAAGFSLTLADSVLDEPFRARSLQLLIRGVDLSKPLTRYELGRLVERAYLIDGRLDFTLIDLARMDTKKVRAAVRAQVEMDLAKHGAVRLFESLGYFKKESFWQKMLRLYEHPAFSTAILIPTWNMTASHMPGYLPTVRWMRVSKKDLRGFLEFGLDAYLPNAEPALRRALAFQTTYDFTQSLLAVWAGSFTVGYAATEILGLGEDKAEDLVIDQSKPIFEHLRDALPF